MVALKIKTLEKAQNTLSAIGFIILFIYFIVDPSGSEANASIAAKLFSILLPLGLSNIIMGKKSYIKLMNGSETRFTYKKFVLSNAALLLFVNIGMIFGLCHHLC